MLSRWTQNAKDVTAGLIFTGLGLAFAIIAYLDLPIGTSTRMGPGYFPIMLGGVLVVLGVAMALRGIASGETSEFGAVPWRGAFFTAAALVFFATTLDGLGIAVAVFFAAVIGSLASTRITAVQAIATGAVLSVMCALIFGEWLNLAVPAFGPWVRFW